MNEDTEIWKDVPKYIGYYQSSSLGRVKSLDRLIKGRDGFYAKRKSVILKPSKSKTGYLRCVVINESSKKNMTVHRLVAMAFVYNPKPNELTQINHKDGNKLNNKPDNLEWCTITQNNQHARKTGLNIAKSGLDSHSYGLKNKQSHVLVNIITGETKPICEVAIEYGYTTRHITMMVKGERNNKTNYIIKDL